MRSRERAGAFRAAAGSRMSANTNAKAEDQRGRPPSIADSLREYGRGLAGGLLFSLPLLYTMEVWWSGFIAAPARLLILLAGTSFLLLGYNRYSGMRRDSSWSEVAIDCVEELGLGVLAAAGVLFLLGRIGPGSSFEENLGKIVVESAIVAIGFSVGTAQLGTGSRDGGMGSGRGADRGVSHQVVISLCGAVLFAGNVGPTEEIPMVAMEASPGRLLGIVVLSIALATLVLYFIDFTGSRTVQADGKMDIVLGSAITYAAALAASAAILWFFGRFDGVSASIAARQIAVLGLPASLGASAGRLLLQI